jgi:hypothetical protein
LWPTYCRSVPPNARLIDGQSKRASVNSGGKRFCKFLWDDLRGVPSRCGASFVKCFPLRSHLRSLGAVELPAWCGASLVAARSRLGPAAWRGLAGGMARPWRRDPDDRGCRGARRSPRCRARCGGTSRVGCMRQVDVTDLSGVTSKKALGAFSEWPTTRWKVTCPQSGYGG